MVTRAYLTKEFINSISLPEKGERWISDTVIKGFGLRIWRFGHTTGAAFAIRTTDFDGKSVRRTYQPWVDYSTYCPPRSWVDFERLGHVRPKSKPMDLASHSDVARLWARDQIAELKGQLCRKTIDVLRSTIILNRHNIVKQERLGLLVDLFFTNATRKHYGWSQEYFDSLWQTVGDYIRETNISDLTIEDIEQGALIETLWKKNLRAEYFSG